MAAAGLGVQAIFSASHATPQRPSGHAVVATHFSWNYTSYLNIVFISLPSLFTGFSATVLTSAAVRAWLSIQFAACRFALRTLQPE